MTQIIKFLMGLSICFLSDNLFCQCAKYEPADGKVLFIIGQDCNATGKTAYGSGYMDDPELGSIIPAGITTYYSLTVPAGAGLTTLIDWGSGPLHAQQYIGNTIYTNAVISIGLFMTDGFGNTLNVNGGGYNDHLDALANWIKSVSPRPVYLRIGYEFDGQYWASPAAYRNAWIYIVDRFRSQGVDNCAYVWQAASGNGGTAHLLQWYPGDNYVDWLGYSHFEFDGNLNEGADIFTLARQKRKPVMIAEATPKGLRLDNSSEATAAWNGYFTRLFNKINANIDVVKALCYINQDWDAQSLWAGQDWGNSRIQANGNGTIEANWVNEISKPFWQHASADLWVTLENSNTQEPYGGTPKIIPGTVQAEDFDEGCLGVSYYDNSGGNTGGSVHRYGYSVDIGPTADVSGQEEIGWTATGEWLEYTVEVSTTASYNFTFRVATPNSGNTFHLEQDGIDISGVIFVPNTGGWGIYTDLQATNISLTAGTHVLRIYFDYVPSGFNINYFTVSSSTLPVTFSSVRAVFTDEGTYQLEWITQLEKNLRMFEVERSLDGKLFEKIGEVEGKNNLIGASYVFDDSILYKGTIYYRIRQVDYDFSSSYSQVTSVTGIPGFSYVLYPNPCADDLFIKGTDIEKIRLHDVYGATLMTLEESSSSLIWCLALDRLPSGIYMLTIHTTSGQTISKRIFKESDLCNF